MMVIYNNILPVKGFKCINLFVVLFVRKGLKMTDVDFNHEAIHTKQMKEMLYVFFYLWYVIEWIVRLFKRGNAYRNISFEREAYSNQCYLKYNKERKRFAWLEYLSDK